MPHSFRFHGNGVPTRTLPENPDLEQLRTQAKELLRAFRAGDAEASSEVNAHFHNADRATFALHDAQLALARCYGFSSWPKMLAYVNGATVRRLCEAVRAGDLPRVRVMLKVRPELASLDLAENDEHRALHYAVFARSSAMVKLLMEHDADARQGIYPHREATSPYRIAVERGYTEIVALIEEEEARRGGALTSAPDEILARLKNRDEAGALNLLEAHPDLAQSGDGAILLQLAAGAASERATAWLLEHGAEMKTPGPRGMTVLDRAVRAGAKAERVMKAERVIKLLRAAGAEMTARAAVALGDADWLRARHAEGTLENPLHWPYDGLLTIAVQFDRPEILTLLLDFGLDPNERVRVEGVEEVIWSAGSPLWHCADSGKIAMAALLLERGANPNVHVYASGPPVHQAYLRCHEAKGGHEAKPRGNGLAMIDLLEQYGGVLPPVSIGLLREKQLAKRMLAGEAAGRRLPEGILEGRNVSEDLLRGAADSGDAEIVSMALPGVDWPRNDGRWYWILMQAVWAGSTECFGLILARCDANLRHPHFGRTLLHDVAGLGLGNTDDKSAASAALLLDAGARLDERDDVLRSTPLGWACRWGKIEMVKLLLDRGADPAEPAAEPWASPLAWAEKAGNPSIAAILRKRMP